MIRQELLNHFPGWWQDLALNPEKYYFVLTNDLDSLCSCRFLTNKTGVQIGGYFDFKRGVYISENLIDTNKSLVYVDASIIKDGIMCFDNHRTMGKNHMMINPNVITDRLDDKTYFKKYNGSTLMLVCALYGNTEEFSELQKEYMLTIDGFYKGYYRNTGCFRHINIKWLELLGLDKTLVPILEKHDADYFQKLTETKQLTEEIVIDEDGFLYMNRYNSSLPNDRFILKSAVTREFCSKDEVATFNLSDESLFGASETLSGRYIINRHEPQERIHSGRDRKDFSV